MILNCANRSYPAYRLGFPRRGRWRVRLNSDWQGYGDDFGGQPSLDTTADGGPLDGMSHSAELGVGPYGAILLSQDE